MKLINFTLTAILLLTPGTMQANDCPFDPDESSLTMKLDDYFFTPMFTFMKKVAEQDWSAREQSRREYYREYCNQWQRRRELLAGRDELAAGIAKLDAQIADQRRSTAKALSLEQITRKKEQRKRQRDDIARKVRNSTKANGDLSIRLKNERSAALRAFRLARAMTQTNQILEAARYIVDEFNSDASLIRKLFQDWDRSLSAEERKHALDALRGRELVEVKREAIRQLTDIDQLYGVLLRIGARITVAKNAAFDRMSWINGRRDEISGDPILPAEIKERYTNHLGELIKKLENTSNRTFQNTKDALDKRERFIESLRDYTKAALEQAVINNWTEDLKSMAEDLVRIDSLRDYVFYGEHYLQQMLAAKRSRDYFAVQDLIDGSEDFLAQLRVNFGARLEDQRERVLFREYVDYIRSESLRVQESINRIPAELWISKRAKKLGTEIRKSLDRVGAENKEKLILLGNELHFYFFSNDSVALQGPLADAFLAGIQLRLDQIVLSE